MPGSARDDQLQVMLSKMVEGAVRPNRPKRFRWGISVGSFAAAGVLAGALTAGALVIPNHDASLRQDQMVTFATYQLNGGSLAGDARFSQGSGTATIALPPRPTGLIQLVVGVWCLSGKNASVSAKKIALATSDCRSGAAETPRVAATAMTPAMAGALSVDGSGSYAVFVSWYKPAPIASASESQNAATDDGVVTRQEYLDGYARLVGCMGQAGYQMDPPRAYDVLIQYGLNSTELPTFDHDCYPREFQDVDTLWQSEVGQRATACLAKVGIVPDARDSADWVSVLGRHGLTAIGCGLLQ